MATEQLRGSSRYLSFPFRVEGGGARHSGRLAHIREQIALLLLTQPDERVFLPEWGIGAAQLLFMPMTPRLWSRIEAALASGVAEALKGEAIPGSIQVAAGPQEGRSEVLEITIRYRLAALNRDERLRFTVSNGEIAVDSGVDGG